MSTSDALATVTATLRHLLNGVASLVTTKPPSVARDSETNSQLNIFLYSVQSNPAFSNFPLPGSARSGENSPPPLALIVNYLLTAYGDNDDDISGQQVMGQAMSVLHDHPLLGLADINGIAPDSGLQNQVERVRITLQPITMDEMSKLWTGFQSAEYRLSVVYQASVVLIDSTRNASAALPVLRRGEQNRGANVTAAPLPVLTGMRFPNQKPGAELGDRIVILGEHLAADAVTVRFEHPLLLDPSDPTKKLPIELTPVPGSSDTELQVVLPSAADDSAVGSKWPAGFYQVALAVVQPDGPALISNRLAMPLAPQITSVNPAMAAAGNINLAVTCSPRVRPEQTAVLLFGSRFVQPDNVITPPDPTQPTMLTFTVTDVTARPEPYALRLRLDGVDSIPVDFSGAVPQFAPNQTVTVT